MDVLGKAGGPRVQGPFWFSWGLRGPGPSRQAEGPAGSPVSPYHSAGLFKGLLPSLRSRLGGPQPSQAPGTCGRMGEGLCSHRPVLGALCPHLLLDGRTVRKLRLRGVCGLRLGWELQGHGVWPGLEKTDEAPPEPNPGHEAHCACACRLPGAEAGLLLGPQARVSPAHCRAPGTRSLPEKPASPRRVGQPCPAAGAAPSGLSGLSCLPGGLGNGLLKGSAWGPPPATPGSRRRNVSVDMGLEPGTMQNTEAILEEVPLPPRLSRRQRARGQPSLAGEFGFLRGGQEEGPSFLVLLSPQQIQGLLAFVSVGVGGMLRRPLLAGLHSPPPPPPLAAVAAAPPTPPPHSSSSPPSGRLSQAHGAPAAPCPAEAAPGLRGTEDGFAGRTQLFQQDRKFCACAHKSFRKLTHLTFPKMSSKLQSLGNLKAF